jgi:hypothetical protein
VIPAVDPDTRLLPANADKSPHLATMSEVYQVFVVDAPNRDRRELIFGAFRIYAQLLWTHFPDARLWLNGGFVTYKDAEPHDLDVAFLVDSADLAKVFQEESDALSLLTFQGVSSQQPVFANIGRLQPFGGLIDSFFVPSDIPQVVDTWKDQWSMASNPAGDGYRNDLFKGYLEVGA